MAFMLAVGLLFMKLVKDLKGKPAASEVAAEAADRYVTKRQCDRSHDGVTAILGEIFSKLTGVEQRAANALDTEIRDLRKERKEDATVLQAQLTAFSENVGALKQASALQTDQLKRMDEKLDYLMQQR
jgi:hypothetical protein